MGREWIGIDISPTAVNLIRRRVEKEGAVDVNGASTVKIMGLPVTEEELKALKPFEFQNWVIQRFNGTHSPRKSGDMGIDGYSFLEHHPIQVKRSERVGRNTVDNFETAIERDSRDKGYIVAFSFTRDAREEVARAKSAKGMEIQLVKVSGLLEETADIATLTTLFAEDQPLPPVRSKETRPSVEDLVESEKVE
jgi:hypothetical protein